MKTSWKQNQKCIGTVFQESVKSIIKSASKTMETVTGTWSTSAVRNIEENE